MPAVIETRALRKVYPAPPHRRAPPRGGPQFAPPAPRHTPVGTHVSGGIAALDSLDLAVRQGEFFGLLGPNGAGKTTTIGILTTRVRATSGDAIVAGANVRTEDVAVRRRIAALQHLLQLPIGYLQVARHFSGRHQGLRGVHVCDLLP